jgi:hypothetical protein
MDKKNLIIKLFKSLRGEKEFKLNSRVKNNTVNLGVKDSFDFIVQCIRTCIATIIVILNFFADGENLPSY